MGALIASHLLQHAEAAGTTLGASRWTIEGTVGAAPGPSAASATEESPGLELPSASRRTETQAVVEIARVAIEVIVGAMTRPPAECIVRQ